MSRAIHIEESVTIQRPPEVVWSTVADYSTDAALVPRHHRDDA
jgi:hypothetical protein